MTEGIPQGTTLGSLFFIVYVCCADDIDAIDELKLIWYPTVWTF